MNFENAYKKLLEGKKIRRKEWEPFMHIRYVDDMVKTYKSETQNYYQNSNLLISTGWKVVDGDGKSLSFIDAIEELRQKKCITRDDWENDKFLFIDGDKIACCYAVEYDFMPTWKCLNSHDWEVMK